jgi:hypothetical protein
MAASLVTGVTRGCAWRFAVGMEEGKVAMTALVESAPLKLYFHPFASFCQKALIAFYENRVPFEPIVVDLADEASRAAFEAVWPIARFPVLRDDARDRLVPESSVIIEYLDLYYPGPTMLVPDDADAALTTRMRDRFFDFYVSEPMQKIVTDRIRPAGKRTRTVSKLPKGFYKRPTSCLIGRWQQGRGLSAKSSRWRTVPLRLRCSTRTG